MSVAHASHSGQATKRKVGDWVGVPMGGQVFLGHVIEDRGPLGPQGKQVVRVILDEPDAGGKEAFDVPGEWLRAPPTSMRTLILGLTSGVHYTDRDIAGLMDVPLQRVRAGLKALRQRRIVDIADQHRQDMWTWESLKGGAAETLAAAETAGVSLDESLSDVSKDPTGPKGS